MSASEKNEPDVSGESEGFLDLFRVIRVVKNLTAAVKAGDWFGTSGVLEQIKELLGFAQDANTPVSGGLATFGEESGVGTDKAVDSLKEAAADFERVKADFYAVANGEPNPTQPNISGADPKAMGFDVASLFKYLELAGDIVSAVLTWLRNRPATA